MNNLRLRRVEENDIELIFNWSNDSEVRKNSFHTEPIKWEEHVKWFGKVLQNDAVLFLILTDGNKNIGQIRLDFENKNEAIVTYDIDKKYRLNGYGKEILKLIENFLRENFKYQVILYALVKIENKISQSVFKKLHYTIIENDNREFIKYAKVIFNNIN